MNEVEAAPAFAALEGLLGVFRAGRIVEPQAEREAFDRHVLALSEAWDREFPGFPREYFPFTSFRGEWHRGQRDAYLKDIVVRRLAAETPGTVVNPACVFGRHGRHVARRLPRHRVIATDVDWRWDWWYRLFNRERSPPNFEFRQDDVFAPKLDVRPSAVVFFGACGAVTDGAIDYAIRAGAPHLIFRTCCHDNIAGNTKVAKRPTHINRFFRFKNRVLEWMRAKRLYAGFYFSGKYTPAAWPRSCAARALTDSAELLEVASQSPESDVCRAIIDLDRYLYLRERGYEVWYQGELFVAERTAPAGHRTPPGDV